MSLDFNILCFISVGAIQLPVAPHRRPPSHLHLRLRAFSLPLRHRQKQRRVGAQIFAALLTIGYSIKKFMSCVLDCLEFSGSALG